MRLDRLDRSRPPPRSKPPQDRSKPHPGLDRSATGPNRPRSRPVHARSKPPPGPDRSATGPDRGRFGPSGGRSEPGVGLDRGWTGLDQGRSELFNGFSSWVLLRCNLLLKCSLVLLSIGPSCSFYMRAVKDRANHETTIILSGSDVTGLGDVPKRSGIVDFPQGGLPLR